MEDSEIDAILILQTSTFIMSDPSKFNFVGSILEAMLVKVPSDNAIVNAYCKQPTSGVHPMTEELRKAIEEITNRKGEGCEK